MKSVFVRKYDGVYQKQPVKYIAFALYTQCVSIKRM